MPPPRVFSNYKITNTINGKLYIGACGWNPYHRWSQHKANARGGARHPLYDEMREYGIEYFTFEVIIQHRGQHGNEIMLAVESALIIALNTLVPNGYNRMARGSTRKKAALDDDTAKREAIRKEQQS